MKLLVIIMALIMGISTACAEEVGMANPITEYETLEEVNELTGGRLCHPGVMGVSEERFRTIAGETPVGQYQFELNGYEYCFRFSRDTAEDISGMYIDAEAAFEGEATEEAVYAADSEYKVARWKTVDGQYTLAVSDAGEMDIDLFHSIVEEMMVMTDPAVSEMEAEVYYASLAGEYLDEKDGVATALVVSNGSVGVIITITIPEGENSYHLYEMTACETEEDVLAYDDMVHTLVTILDDGTEDRVIGNDIPDGCFRLTGDGKLRWFSLYDDEDLVPVFAPVGE